MNVKQTLNLFVDAALVDHNKASGIVLPGIPDGIGEGTGRTGYEWSQE